jgi:hypothetical protein
MIQLKGVINMASKDLACEVTSVISDLYRYLRDLLGVRLVELDKFLFTIWQRLEKAGVRIPYVAITLTPSDLGVTSIFCSPNVVFYLNQEDYLEVMKVEHCYAECVALGDESGLSKDIKPGVTVLDFARAVAVMGEEYAKELEAIKMRQMHRASEGSLIDLPIGQLMRNEVDSMEGWLSNGLRITIEREADEFKVTVSRGPIECDYRAFSIQPLRVIINLFNKYIAPLYKRPVSPSSQ